MNTTTMLLHPFDQIAALTPISLDLLNDAAALQQRVDRKYVVDAAQLATVLDALRGRMAALEIDGDRSFRYESVYFDTMDLACYRAAAQRRRRRFKVRTRSYLDTETTMLEIKTRGQRGNTVKRRQPHPFEDRATLDDDAIEFIDAELGQGGVATLWPTLTTAYRRTTLVDLDDIARVTIDANLRCMDWTGRSVGLVDDFIVETKSGGSPSATDRQLWAAGLRPEKISKFGTGLAALHPELPSNKWHRTLQRHF